MQISQPTRGLAATAAVVLLLVAAPAHARQSSGAMTGAPTIGTCSRLTPAQAGGKTDASTPVSCKKAHTARVAGVAKLPSSWDWATATRKDVFRAVAATCAPQVATMLGRTAAARDTTAYDYVYFLPTKADRSQGARWVSCSIVLDQGTSLADLPRNHTPMLGGGKHPDAVARCLTKAVATTTCSSGHSWRATGTFTLDRATRPEKRALDKIATRRCLSLVAGHGAYYRFTYQDPISWAAGDHTVVCYSHTSA